MFRAVAEGEGVRALRSALEILNRSELVTQTTHGATSTNIMFLHLIATPSHVTGPGSVGDYLLFFSGHHGPTLWVAHAASPTAAAADWTILDTGVTLARVHALTGSSTDDDDHVSSPHVRNEQAAGELTMFFHSSFILDATGQATCYAVCSGGDLTSWTLTLPMLKIMDNSSDSASYHRPIGDERLISVGNTGYLWTTSDPTGRSGWVPVAWNVAGGDFFGNVRFPPNNPRHSAIVMDGTVAHVFFTRSQDSPERIMRSTFDTADRVWELSAPSDVMRASYVWEGSEEDPAGGGTDISTGLNNALRDPGFIIDDDRLLMTYAYGGEYGGAIADLTEYAAANGIDVATAYADRPATPGAVVPLTGVTFPVSFTAGLSGGELLRFAPYHTHSRLFDGDWDYTITVGSTSNNNQHIVYLHGREELMLNIPSKEVRLRSDNVNAVCVLSSMATDDVIDGEVRMDSGATLQHRARVNGGAWTAWATIAADWSIRRESELVLGAKSASSGLSDVTINSLVFV